MSDAAFYFAVVILVVLCAGDPDLLDAITKRVAECPVIVK